MGSTVADGLAEAVENGTTTLEAALTYHLTCNHYPPLPTSLVPVAVKVIELLDSFEGDTLVDLPEGITYRGETQAPAWACCEAWHLLSFLS